MKKILDDDDEEDEVATGNQAPGSGNQASGTSSADDGKIIFIFNIESFFKILNYIDDDEEDDDYVESFFDGVFGDDDGKDKIC